MSSDIRDREELEKNILNASEIVLKIFLNNYKNIFKFLILLNKNGKVKLVYEFLQGNI